MKLCECIPITPNVLCKPTPGPIRGMDNASTSDSEEVDDDSPGHLNVNTPTNSDSIHPNPPDVNGVDQPPDDNIELHEPAEVIGMAPPEPPDTPDPPLDLVDPPIPTGQPVLGSGPSDIAPSPRYSARVTRRPTWMRDSDWDFG